MASRARPIVPTIRPSGKTSILAPVRCGVEPLARTIVTSAAGSPRSSADAAAGRTSSFIGGGRSDQNLDLRFLLQLLDEGVLAILLLLPIEELLDLRRHLLEGHGALRLAIGDLDDVVSVLRRHHIAQLARLERERRVVELRQHRAGP